MKRIIALLGVLVLVLAACGGGEEGDSGGDGAAAGEEIFSSTCAACHGADATGIEGLGKDLHNNTFVDGLSDDELVDFIKEGREADHPDNEAGVAMPPNGGNPSLTDDDLLNVVAYLRTLK
jgi:mono/diheme cytochrome c family protein